VSRPLKTPPPYAIASVDHALRAAAMLQLEDGLTVSEVAERLGVARSTAHRLLAMLVYRPAERPDLARLRAELARIRRKGFAVNRERSERGLVAVGVAVRGDDSTAQAGLSVSMPRVRYDPLRLPSLVATLGAAGRRLEADLAAAPLPDRPGARDRAGGRATGHVAHPEQAPEVLLHLACRTVGVSGPDERQQPAAWTGGDAARRRPDRDHQVVQLAGNIPEQQGQDRVPGRVGQQIDDRCMRRDLPVPVEPLRQAARLLDAIVQGLQVPRGHPPARDASRQRAHQDQLVIH
jgi:Bacterial transcriptional regulator/IclR helix-turn-helix domain